MISGQTCSYIILTYNMILCSLLLNVQALPLSLLLQLKLQFIIKTVTVAVMHFYWILATKSTSY